MDFQFTVFAEREFDELLASIAKRSIHGVSSTYQQAFKAIEFLCENPNLGQPVKTPGFEPK